MSKLLVVVGALGGQGSAVIRYFQQHEPTYKLRGLTRNPTSDAAKKLAGTGVEVVKADLNDVASLKEAFKGANAIFAYTDSASLVPQVMGRVMSGESPGPIGAAASAIEIQQGQNIAGRQPDPPRSCRSHAVLTLEQ